MKSLVEATVGQRLSFCYYGGSKPGTFRVVEVTEVLDDRIRGIDEAKEEHREYLVDKATLITVLPPDVVPVPVAEAACDEPVDLNPTTRVCQTTLSFVDARQHLHDQIDELCGEDLAEVLAEIDGKDRARFDADQGIVVLEQDVPIPHCRLNQTATDDTAGIDWVNENGDTVTSVSTYNGKEVVFLLDGEPVTPEELVVELFDHLDLHKLRK